MNNKTLFGLILAVNVIVFLVAGCGQEGGSSISSEQKFSSPLEECNHLCEQIYEAQGQIDICQTSCENTDYLGGEEKTKSLIKNLKDMLAEKD